MTKQDIIKKIDVLNKEINELEKIQHNDPKVDKWFKKLSSLLKHYKLFSELAEVTSIFTKRTSGMKDISELADPNFETTKRL